MKNTKIILTITLLLVFLYQPLFGQPFNPNNPVPLDGGISLLIAAGAGLGIKKIYQARKAHK